MKKTILVDDLDGTDAAETIPFGFDGNTYEIDLSSGNAAELRNSLARYAKVARPIRTNNTRSKVTNSGPTDTEVRAWAKANKVKVNPKGRVPGGIRAQYVKAQKS